MRCKFLIGCLLVLAATTLGQQQPPAAPAAAPSTQPTPATKPASPRGVALLGEDGQPVAGVKLMSADLKSVIRGPLAEASLTLTFVNETDRVLGGELTFPLPESATVAGYALDVDGVLVDGVAVEKQQARIIYETEMNKRVDPGLVEQVVGNNFRTRLYPIAAKGTRTARVTYIADLAASPDGKGASLTMPVGLANQLAAFNLSVAVEGAAQPPIVKANGYTSKDFQGSPRGVYLQDTIRDARAMESLTVLLPEVASTGVFVAKREITPATVDELEAEAKQQHDANPQTEHYFVITDSPQRPDVKAAAMPVLKNQHVLVVWDASLSRQNADLNRERKLLEQTLERLSYPAVDLAILRNDLEVVTDIGSGRAAASALIERLKMLTYDGGTNLGALSLPKNRRDLVAHASEAMNYDMALLFSDGIGTLGGEKPVKVEIPVYAITSDPSADHAGLRKLCQSSGGAYLNLNRQTDAAALDAIARPPFSIIGFEYDPAKIQQVTPGVGAAVNGRVTIAGRLLAPEANVTVIYGLGSQRTDRCTFTISAKDATDDQQIPRFWAQQQANELSLQGDSKRDELVALGKHFNLVTSATSLLVLETVDQYVQHGIVPPKSRTAVYTEFTQKIEQRRVAQAKTKDEKLQQVLAMWEEKKKWWTTEFKAPATMPDLAGNPSTQPFANGLVFGAGATRPADGSRVLARWTRLSANLDDPTSRPSERAREIRDLTVDVPNFTDAPNFDLVAAGQGQRRQGGGGGSGALFGNAGGGRLQLGGQSINGELENVAQAGSSITIQPWDPKTPYLDALKAAKPDETYSVFLTQREKFSKSPAFYLECADFFLRINQRSVAIRVLSDVVELKLDDSRLTRIAAHRLQQVGEFDLAISLFDRVLKQRPEEPQSLRDLALALAARAEAQVAGNAGVPAGIQQKKGSAGEDAGVPRGKHASAAVAADYCRARGRLNQIVVRNWDGRFPQIETIALMEANAIAARLQRSPELGAIPNPIDPRLRQNLDCDLRIVLTWDADQTDIDLWVTEPTQELCMYNHNRTMIGGAISPDFTQGYGPEEYAIHKAIGGQYTINANFYGSRQQELTGACTVQATVITDFGRPNEKRQAMTLRLTGQKETVTVGTVLREAPKK
jgi:hypothetical protein